MGVGLVRSDAGWSPGAFPQRDLQVPGWSGRWGGRWWLMGGSSYIRSPTLISLRTTAEDATVES